MRAQRLAALLVLAAALRAPVPTAAADLTVRFTASVLGSLEGCDCKLTPRAGLVKTAAWLRGVHRPGADLLVDAGDLFPPDRDSALERALLETLSDLGYAAVAVGERELAAGPEALAALRPRFPLLCNNLSLRDAAGAWAPFDPEPLVVPLAGGPVAVVALLDPAVVAELPAAVRARVRLEAPRETAARLLARPSVRAATFVVLLYHGSRAAAEALVDATKGIDLAVVAHEQELVAAHRRGDAVVVSPGEAGNRVGEVSLLRRPLLGPGFGARFQAFDARFGPDDGPTRERLRAYEAELRARLR